MYCFSSTFPQDLFWWCRGAVAQNTFTLFPLLWYIMIYKQFFVKLKWARIVPFSCNGFFFEIMLLRFEGWKRQSWLFLINSIYKIQLFLLFLTFLYRYIHCCATAVIILSLLLSFQRVIWNKCLFVPPQWLMDPL